MADVKIVKGSPFFKPDISEEQKAEALKALDEYLLGAGQKMVGEGRREAVDKFTKLLDSLNPERLRKLEQEIKSLHGMDKFERFRTQFFLILMDTFQGGMFFAVDPRSIENRLDLAKILNLPQPGAEKKS
jgi:hypothetical protein